MSEQDVSVADNLEISGLYAALEAARRRQRSALRHGLWHCLKDANDDVRRIQWQIAQAGAKDSS